MKRSFKVVLASLATAGVIALSGCGTVVRTGQDYQAIHYTGGDYSKQQFADCVGPGDRRRDGMGDADYYYPAGERTFQFDGTDAPPIAIQTSDSQEVTVSGFITFRFTDDCAILRKFHEDKGLKQKAYFTLADSETNSIDYKSDGWGDFLTTYFQTPARDAMNAQSLKYGWKPLYSDPATQSKFREDAVKNLPAAINAAVGNGVISIVGIQTLPPQPSDALKQTLVDVEKAKSEARAETERANAQKTAQEAKNQLIKKQFEGTKECIKVLTKDQCTTLELANRGDVKFYPYGSNLNLPNN